MLFNKNIDRPIRGILAFVIFLIVAIPISFNSSFINIIDIFIDGHIQAYNFSALENFYKIFSGIFSPIMELIYVLLIAIYLWLHSNKIQSIWSIALIFSGDIINEIVKHIIKRPRPRLHLASATGPSFPSTHVLSTLLLMSVIILIIVPMIKKSSLQTLLIILSVIIVILVTLARVYVRAHFFTDTLGAILLGYTWLQIGEYLYIKFAPKLKNIKLLSNSNL